MESLSIGRYFLRLSAKDEVTDKLKSVHKYQFSFSVYFFSFVDHHYLKASFIALMRYTKTQTELLENAVYYYMDTLLSNTNKTKGTLVHERG